MHKNVLMQADCELGTDEKYVANLDSTSAHKLDILKSKAVFVKKHCLTPNP